MKELLTPHWAMGTTLAIGGAVAFRFGARWLGHFVVSVQLLGLAGVTLGLLVVMRGVSRAARGRPTPTGAEAQRHVPRLRLFDNKKA